MPLVKQLKDLADIRDRLQALRDGTREAIPPHEAQDLQLKLQSILRQRYLLPPSPFNVAGDSPTQEDQEDQETRDKLAYMEQKMDLLMDDIVPLFFEYWLRVRTFLSL
jgi:hypothetical protein